MQPLALAVSLGEQHGLLLRGMEIRESGLTEKLA